MNTDQGRLYYATGIDNTQLQQDAAESRNILAGIGQQAESESNRMDAAFGKIAKAAGGIFAASQISEFINKIVAARGEIESLQISFETLAGASAGNKLFSQIREFAVQTPMMLKDLAAGAQTMLAFNIATEKVMPILKAIGDISMGDAQKFNSLSLAFSQMSATGKLMGQDLLQMINAGFNPLSVISEKTGKSIGELKTEMEAGKISTDMVTEAFISATSEGGKFYGMLEKQSHGINGAISNLQGAIDDMFNDLGEKAQGGIVSTISFATQVVKHYEIIGSILGGIIVTYGAYRAQLIAALAVEKARAAASAETVAVVTAELTAIATKTEAQKLSADADLAAAVAKGELTTAQGLEILTAKQEAAARVEAIAAAAAQAKADAVAATTARIEAGERLKAAEISAAAMRMEYQAALAKGEVFEIAAAKSAVETATAQVNAASEQYQAAATAEATAAKTAKTLATEADTAQNALNTASLDANTAAAMANTRQIGLLALAKKGLQSAAGGLLKVLGTTATIYGAVIGAVGLLAYGQYKQGEAAREAARRQRELNQTIDDTNRVVKTENGEISLLFYRLKEAEKGSKAYESIKEQILSKYGSYLDGLSSEIQSLKDVEGAYKAITKAAREAARARAIASVNEQEGNRLTEAYESAYDRIKARLEKLYRNRTRDDGVKYVDYYLEHFSKVLNGQEEFNQRDIKLFNRKDAAGKSYNPIYDIIKGYWAKQEQSEANIRQAEERLGFYRKDEEADEGDDDNYREGLKNMRKAYADAVANLKKLESQADAKTSDIKAAYEKIDYLKKTLKDKYYVDIDAEAKAGGNAADARDDEANMLASEASQRQKESEEYVRQMADQARDGEFEIRQARIDAMDEGVDKELAQNQLNYDRRKEQNKRLEREMLDELAEQRIRQMEDINPYVFKRKNKDGKWEDDPGKRETAKRDVRQVLGAEDLSPEQQKRLKEFDRIASEAREKANRDSLDKMLEDVLTYQQKRLKIEEEYDRKRKSLYEKDDKGNFVQDENGNLKLRKGVTQGNFDEINRQEEETLRSFDEQIAQRQASYQAWCDIIADMSLNALKKELAKAKKELEKLQKQGKNADPQKLAEARAKVAKAEKAVTDANVKNNNSPGTRTLKEWEDLYKTLQDVKKEFDEIGDAVGGTAGEIIKVSGQIANSTLSMINGIVTLANSSGTAMQGTATAASTAIQTVEKASVILAVISAALQVATAIASLFNNDEEKQENIDALQEEIDALQWVFDNQAIMRVQEQYGSFFQMMSDAVKQTQREYNNILMGSTSWLNSLQRSKGEQLILWKSADKLATAYANIAYSADKALGSNRYSEASSQLQNIAMQQYLIAEQMSQEMTKKDVDTAKLIEWKQKIAELGQQAVSLINEMVEDIIGDSSSGIAQELGDAFVEAFQAGEDAAKAWHDKVNDIVADILKRMLVQKYLEEPLGEIFDEYKERWFPNGQFAGLDAITGSMQDFAASLNEQIDVFQKAMDGLPDDIKTYFTGDDSDREASQKGIATASQDSVDELNGRMTAVQSHTFAISENTRQLLTTTQTILGSLLHIEEETDGLHDRMERVENYTKSIHDSVDDIVNKGIKLK